MNTQYEHYPWLNPENWDGGSTTEEEKFQFKFEYAFESETQVNTQFKEIYPDGVKHIGDISTSQKR